MSYPDFKEMTLFEHRFWLQILGDHARFIHDALSPSEEPFIAEAQGYKQTFDSLLGEARDQLCDIDTLTKVAYQKAMELRDFKLRLLSKHLHGQLKISLSPTFLNHMVNELEEYIRILSYLIKGEAPPLVHPVHHHLVWLLDAAGHAGAIEDNLDHTEKMTKAKSRKFTKHFENFYLKAIEMAGYLRTNEAQFPALERFNNNVKLEMVIFQEFLTELKEMELDGSVLSTFSVLMADHMFREECYYLMKLAESAGLTLPDCDPTKPRVKG